MNRWLRCASVAMLCMVSMAVAGEQARAQQFTAPIPSRTVAAGVPLEVYRGKIELWTPAWIELADMGGDIFVLSVLDGLDSRSTPPEKYMLSTNGKRGSGCKMNSTEGLPIEVNGCPGGKQLDSRVDLFGLKGKARFAPVGAAAAMGHSGSTANTDFGNAASCTFPVLSRSGLFPGGRTSAAIGSLTQASAVLTRSAVASATLSQIRRERLVAIDKMIAYPWEQERLNSYDATINRMVDFRYRNQVVQQKQQFETEMANRPERVQARARIAEIDAQLAAVYDPKAALAKRARHAEFRQTGYLAEADRALEGDIGAALPLTVQKALLVERGLGELTRCAASLDPAQQPVLAKAALDRQFQIIAQSFDQSLSDEIESGLRSSALQSRLAEYKSSPGLAAALAAVGKGDVLPFGEMRVAALAAAEAGERNAEAAAEAQARQRAAQAAAEAEAARLAFSSTGANAPTDGDILDAYTRYLYQISLSTKGAAWIDYVPNSRFEMRTRGSLGGELWRVRFDLTGKSCTRAASGTYDCSFIIKNSFSNARDGSFESGMMAFSDSVFGLMSGRNNEGLTGRIQSNNVNRLLLSEEVPMTVRFTFRAGQFDSEQLLETVWDNTIIQMPVGNR